MSVVRTVYSSTTLHRKNPSLNIRPVLKKEMIQACSILIVLPFEILQCIFWDLCCIYLAVEYISSHQINPSSCIVCILQISPLQPQSLQPILTFFFFREQRLWDVRTGNFQLARRIVCTFCLLKMKANLYFYSSGAVRCGASAMAISVDIQRKHSFYTCKSVTRHSFVSLFYFNFLFFP